MTAATRILELAERGRQASAEAARTVRPPRPVDPALPASVRESMARPAGYAAHTRTDVDCPQCAYDCAHYRDASKRVIDCVACDRASEREHERAVWLVFGAAYARTGGTR